MSDQEIVDILKGTKKMTFTKIVEVEPECFSDDILSWLKSKDLKMTRDQLSTCIEMMEDFLHTEICDNDLGGAVECYVDVTLSEMNLSCAQEMGEE
ncbi:hypothetical protein [Thermoactinomyces sp. DSM 45892]|uniref:hypothetical protein n=1 Tax=Thermoactinomyces sp. DSM 45892 TaxID=1882753 RepID=UPI001160663B|nr:hypothetical protein [Thermoactinomyces sp. DSM 45892]